MSKQRSEQKKRLFNFILKFLIYYPDQFVLWYIIQCGDNVFIFDFSGFYQVSSPFGFSTRSGVRQSFFVSDT